jgi:hypothetical protein
MLLSSKWSKIAVFSLLCTVLDIILHNLAGFVWKTDLFNATLGASEVYKAGLFIPAVSLMLFLTFFLLAVVFDKVQAKLPGSKTNKWLSFFVPISVLWLVGFQEGQLLIESAWQSELLQGLSDALPILLLGWLIRKDSATDSPTIASPRHSWIPFLLITFLVVLGRYAGYHFFHVHDTWLIKDVHLTKPLLTFLWTLGLGSAIAWFYIHVGQRLLLASVWQRTLVFGFLIFGLQWLVFNNFLLLFLRFSVIQDYLLLVPGMDIVFTTLGILLSTVFTSREKR